MLICKSHNYFQFVLNRPGNLIRIPSCIMENIYFVEKLLHNNGVARAYRQCGIYVLTAVIYQYTTIA